MSRKLKGSPRRWLTAWNLLFLHLVFHVVFLFGYWLSIVDILTTGSLDFIESHMSAVLAGATSNHFVLLFLLIIHAGVIASLKWRSRRQRQGAIKQVGSQLSHLTAEEKLELLLDEVAELRESLHERSGDVPASNTEFRLRDDVQQADNELIAREEYSVEERAVQTR